MPCQGPGYVYAIQEGADGSVKIGLSCQDPRARLQAMQTGNSRELHLRATAYVLEAGYLEKELHRKLRDHCVRGEWFYPAPKVLRMVQTLGDAKGLDDPDKFYSWLKGIGIDHPAFRLWGMETERIDKVVTYFARQNGYQL